MGLGCLLFNLIFLLSCSSWTKFLKPLSTKAENKEIKLKKSEMTYYNSQTEKHSAFPIIPIIPFIRLIRIIKIVIQIREKYV